MELRGLKAIVTGAARGLGRCFATELASAGAAVFGGDVDTAGLRELRRDTEGCSVPVEVGRVDVADEREVVSFVERACERLGGVDALINNAGILRDGLLLQRDAEGALLRLPTSQWQRVLDVNLSGAFLVAREVAARMVEGDGGVIVNISSLARVGNPGQSSYAASKAGLDALTRTWALELARHRVRVAAVAPGVIDTPILESISDAARATLEAAIPLGRIGRPEEVWRAVRFVLECDFFTGRVVEVDGGATMGA